jgi:hypothetical protein
MKWKDVRCENTVVSSSMEPSRKWYVRREFTTGCLKEFPVAQYGAGFATKKHERVAHALGTMDGNCLRLLGQ